MAELKKKSAKSAKNKAKCSKKNKTWSEEELTTFAHVLASNEERDKPWALVLETMALKKSSNKKVFGKILAQGRAQQSSPNRRFLPEKSLLYTSSVAAILLLQHNLNLVPVLFALKCTDLCSYSSGSANLRRTTFRHMAFSNSHQTNKCQTICPSRRFVRPLVWKRPNNSGETKNANYFGDHL